MMPSEMPAESAIMASWQLSIIIEWANTIWNGEERAAQLLDRLNEEWQEIGADRYPDNLPIEAIEFLQRRGPRHELLIVSGIAGVMALEADVRRRAPQGFDVAVHVSEGLEYYPLKNFGARLAHGDFLLFVDSDVLPERGWLAHLLGSFARPDVRVVCGQTYVEPKGFYSRAFTLGWRYELRDKSPGLFVPRRFFANNIVFRSEVFRQAEFPPIGRRSRGGCSALAQVLEARGIRVWENREAGVDHPPPAGLRHLVIRALVDGRDYYLKDSPDRSFNGVKRALRTAWTRQVHAYGTTTRHWRRVGLRRREVPAAMAVMAFYYAIVAIGGVLTYVRPGLTHRFRI